MRTLTTGVTPDEGRQQGCEAVPGRSGRAMSGTEPPTGKPAGAGMSSRGSKSSEAGGRAAQEGARRLLERYGISAEWISPAAADAWSEQEAFARSVLMHAYETVWDGGDG